VSTDNGALGYPAADRCLLDLDADLAEAVAPDARRVARAAATATVLEAEPGPVAAARWLTHTHSGPGVLLIDGIMCLTVRVGDRLCAELLGAGDLITPEAADLHPLIGSTESWRALTPTRIALLDGAFALRVRFWPSLAQALVRRAGRRVHHMGIQRAITAQPRLEVRLALLLWHLADRWGRVERGGVRLTVPLTHQLLGQMVAAERPSVSHALGRLAQAGLITGHGDEWHLIGDLEESWRDPAPPLDGRAEHIVERISQANRTRSALMS
jgi:CRP-like cAMP-binding protein